MQKLEFHPLANIFPLMEEKEFEALVDDIEANGQLEAIWLYEGKIIDGRNRYRACVELGASPKCREWQGEGSLVEFITSMNLHRRHLTASQWAAVAVEIEAEIAKEIAEESGEKKRQAALERESEKRGECIQNQTIPKTGNSGRVAVKEAATLTGGKAGKTQISEAKKLKDDAPDLFDEVKEGKKTVGKAKREYKKRTFVPPDPIQGKYRVFYADPPWQYSNEYSGGDEQFQGKWTAAETHYPTMSIKELCEMGEDIRRAAEENAVLFLWTTEPIRDEAVEVVEAWGFKRKAAFIWDKTRDSFGHYNSVQHEHLLICTRGSCKPDAGKNLRSIVAEPKTPKHSEKPERFREIIDTLYTWGNRIELFARGQVPEQWESWGNEA